MSDHLVLKAERLILNPGSQPISESILKREILGLAGLDGHGQSMFLEALAGVFAPVSGTVVATSEACETPIRSLADAARAHIRYMPSDRKKNGIFPNLSVEDNFTLGSMKRFSAHGWLDKAKARIALDLFRTELSMVYSNRHIPIADLSGGNQQKVLLARAMAANPKVMLLNDPTRGVDIQTRHTLYDYFRQAVKERNMTLVILSTELDEIIELCDRVIVFREYEISARLTKNKITMETLMAAMFGQQQESLS